MDAKKHESSFWKLWTADANFGSSVKKSFKPEEILVEAGEPYDTMKNLIAMLMQETQALKLMQEVRSKTKNEGPVSVRRHGVGTPTQRDRRADAVARGCSVGAPNVCCCDRSAYVALVSLKTRVLGRALLLSGRGLLR